MWLIIFLKLKICSKKLKNVKRASILGDRGDDSGDDEDLNSRDHDYRADTK